MTRTLTDRISNGETNLVFELIESGASACSEDGAGVSMIKWCAYYGDVSAIKFLLMHGENIGSLGDNLDLNGAVFHGHPQLCSFLIEKGADVNKPLMPSGETPLHSAFCKSDRTNDDRVLEVLLANGANPNCVTHPSVETGSFMRDVRTRAETPLHRAAAFGSETTIQMLLDAGAQVDARDMNGDSPLTWASWHLRPRSILRLLCYDDYRA